ALEMEGHEVLRLVRRPQGLPKEVLWSAESGLSEHRALGGCDAVVHLAGENIARRLWTPTQKRRIRDSRVIGTTKLVEALAELATPPRIFFCASAIGIYGDRGDELLTEESELGQEGFLVNVAQAWESAARQAEHFASRVVYLRFGIVLGRGGGALPRLLLAFRLGLGGRLGSGQQWWSWVSAEDAVRAILYVLYHDEICGPVNITAPQPITNADLTRTLAAVLRRPAFCHVPSFLLKLLPGGLGKELFLASARVTPQKLLRAGFEFRHPSFETALQALLVEK
ncbi:MAG: TIGR01777 family oxidoreductase, partial [Candidatus Sumerlaeaceae bacterium]|nr:TIGR01777 family oxidoreductase [Candidatus Sumerlaeaceae bacterium]